MSMNIERRHKPQITEISIENLIAGEVPCPFRKSEINHLRALNTGADTNDEVAASLGLKQNTVADRRVEIVSKMKSFEEVNADDKLARALGFAILGGWLEPEEFTPTRGLEPIEFNTLYLLTSGFSKEQVKGLTHQSEDEFNQAYKSAKNALGANGHYQLIGRGATMAKAVLVERMAKKHES